MTTISTQQIILHFINLNIYVYVLQHKILDPFRFRRLHDKFLYIVHIYFVVHLRRLHTSCFTLLAFSRTLQFVSYKKEKCRNKIQWKEKRKQ